MEEIDRALIDEAIDEAHVPRVYRDRSSPFETLSDMEFYVRFRFTRAGFNEVVLHMAELERKTARSFSLTVAQRLAITLHILAGNPFQQSEGDMFGVTQSTVSRTLEEVTDFFSENVGEFVKWHTAKSEKEMAARVFQKYHLPSVVGAIDGTFIRIQAPDDNEYVYMNRKGFHSLNVSVIVDDSYRILWFSPKCPGSSHDSKVFSQSALHERFAKGQMFGRLVGDSAYKAEKFLIKVFSSGRRLTPQQQQYNNAICAFRVIVEQAFGQIKRIFHMLHSELRYHPARASKIVATAFCLRNLQLTLREPLIDVEPETGDMYSENDEEEEDRAADEKTGLATMEAIVKNYF